MDYSKYSKEQLKDMKPFIERVIFNLKEELAIHEKALNQIGPDMENNVKRIFFSNDNIVPSFELEDGTIRSPHRVTSSGLFVWLTDEENELRMKKNRERDSKRWWRL